MGSDCVETNADGDISTVVLTDKGKGADPQEYGSTLHDPKLMIVPAETTSPGGSDTVIELVDVHRDKDPVEGGNGMAKDEPGPNQIDIPDDEEMISQAILLESIEPTVPTDLNDGLPYDPTLPRLPWRPKISPYCFTIFLTPLIIGTVKAVSSQKGSATTPITLEWINGGVISL